MSIASNPFPGSIHSSFFRQRHGWLTQLVGKLSNIEIQDEVNKCLRANILQEYYALQKTVIWKKNLRDANIPVNQNLACSRATERVEKLIIETEKMLQDLGIEIY